jgi:hypothetical protein
VGVKTCERCGAPLDVPEDGRSYGCRYCGAEVQVAVEASQIAAGMRLDLSNATAFLARLAQMLETAVGDRTKIQRSGVDVIVLELDLGADVFVAKREGHGVLAQHKRMVRGIALKTATHPLATHVTDNARATAALAALFAHR